MPTVISYSRRSKSAKMLSEMLGADLSVRQIPRSHDTKLINWGCGGPIYNWNPHWLNHPESVRPCTNKIHTFQILQNNDVPTPKWTVNYEEAKTWTRAGGVVYARTELSSSEGRGIVLLDINTIRVDAPLYTLGLGHEEEYRIHVFKEKVIKITLKCPRVNNPNSWIRSHSHGWALNTRARAPLAVSRVAKLAVQALGLDFGAVDIGYKEGNSTAYVFEVNTAPGMIESTAMAYAEAIRGYYS